MVVDIFPLGWSSGRRQLHITLSLIFSLPPPLLSYQHTCCQPETQSREAQEKELVGEMLKKYVFHI